MRYQWKTNCKQTADSKSKQTSKLSNFEVQYVDCHNFGVKEPEFGVIFTLGPPVWDLWYLSFLFYAWNMHETTYMPVGPAFLKSFQSVYDFF